ncbi:flavin monoamine oxidase family protein [Ancylobacter amanitiformis]|uniref:Tryptophan 2-monooxygenase n=1 Tax=Ancylobacter amanitiformis TaxID=217069 RepID=A0ABU0LNJ6_9HYPH|nr:NAD(P)/FAD-dependent oxidoreductase [Ancylobacter amanitiformis]MDQ0510278.1 monoamine oxidase [Ancylobacter amanitiformis]
MSHHHDVIVVGAGAAGLAAGARLHRAGVDVRVLEAATRIGGRAFTDTGTFGVAWDRGCHWLHSASVNPLRAAADDLGLAYLSRGSRQARATHLGERWADESEREAAWRGIDSAFAAIKRAGEAGRDIAASEVLEVPEPWTRLARHWINLMSATEPERLSTLDYVAYADTGENYPVEKGYGALVQSVAQRMAPALAVTTGCPVTRIDWSGRDVALETPLGRLTASQVIVAVPTSVIARGGLAFAPLLPADLAEAFAALPLGAAEKVAFHFDRDVFGVAATSYVDTIDLRDPARRPINFVLNPFGAPMAIGQLGGDNAARLVEAGPGAMEDFGLAALTDAFGAEIARHVTGVATTSWVTDPFIGGAYSCALPGFAHMRARLAQTLGERVRFAGEAVSPHAYSTAHGAYLTGLAAADAALAWLGGRAA